MLKNILAGITGNQSQAQQNLQMPMLQMPQIPQQVQFDPYGQQVSGLKAALMGRMMNGYRL